MINIEQLSKNINKTASLVTSQKNCTDTFLSSHNELKRMYTEIHKILKGNKEKKILYKNTLCQLSDALMHANGLHKQYYFAFDMMKIKKLGNNIYKFKDTEFTANSKIKALQTVLALLNVKDEYNFIHSFNVLKKHGISLSEISKLTHLKEEKLKNIAITQPWHFHCLIKGSLYIRET